MAFGEANTSFIGHQRAMIETWNGKAEVLIEKDLACGGQQQILTADDLRDSHGGVIRRAGKLISR
jgi:hypothetical protein